MGKLLLVAVGVALGTAVAVMLSAREQLDGPARPAPEPQPASPQSTLPGASTVPVSS